MFRFLYSALVLVIVLLLAYVHVLSPDEAKLVLKEGGPVETLSAIGWFLAAAVLVAVSRRFACWDGLIGAFILVLFGLRELDFHKRFTTMGISKIKFFIHPEVPWKEKVIVTLFFLLVLYLVAGFARRNIGQFIERVRSKNPAAVALLCFFLLLPASKVLDRIPNALKESGILLQKGIAGEVGKFEEVSEAGLPYFLIIVTAHLTMESRRNKICPDIERSR